MNRKGYADRERESQGARAGDLGAAITDTSREYEDASNGSCGSQSARGGDGAVVVAAAGYGRRPSRGRGLFGGVGSVSLRRGRES